MSFHRRRSPYNVICIKPYRLTKQTVHLLIVVGRIGRKQNKLDGRPALAHVSPSPKLLFRDNILNISLRNSWKATQEMFDLKKIMKKVIARSVIFNEKSFVLSYVGCGLRGDHRCEMEPWNREMRE